MIDLAPLVTAAVLATEAKTWLYEGVKEQVVRQSFGISLTRYYQHANRVIDSELALQMDPATTRRLQAIRAQRLRSRRLSA